jgi:hypothetical protein
MAHELLNNGVIPNQNKLGLLFLSFASLIQSFVRFGIAQRFNNETEGSFNN